MKDGRKEGVEGKDVCRRVMESCLKMFSLCASSKLRAKQLRINVVIPVSHNPP